MGGFFQNNVGIHSNHLPWVKTKQNFLKKAKYLSLICWKEFVLKSGKNENKELQRNTPNIGKLYGFNISLILAYVG